MISDKFEYSWNKLFKSVEYDIYNIVDEYFGYTIYMADPLTCDIELYLEIEQLPKFYQIINEKYHTNFPLYKNLLIWEIETEIVKTDLLRFFSDKSLPDYLDTNLFKLFFDNPEKELKAHFLNVIKNGHFSYLKGGIKKGDNSEILSVIQMEQSPDELTTTLIIKGSEIGGNYEIIDFFPSMSVLQSKQKPLKGMIHYCSEHLGSLGFKDTNIDFWNFFEPLQSSDFSEGHTNEYLFWGLAFDSNTDYNLSDYNNVVAGINCLQKMKLPISEIEIKRDWELSTSNIDTQARSQSLNAEVILDSSNSQEFIKTWISKGSMEMLEENPLIIQQNKEKEIGNLSTSNNDTLTRSQSLNSEDILDTSNSQEIIKTWILQGAIRIPVFVPKKLLDEKDSNTKELEALVLICGQIQPYEDSSEIIDCDGILKMAEGINKENENTCNS